MSARRFGRGSRSSSLPARSNPRRRRPAPARAAHQPPTTGGPRTVRGAGLRSGLVTRNARRETRQGAPHRNDPRLRPVAPVCPKRATKSPDDRRRPDGRALARRRLRGGAGARTDLGRVDTRVAVLHGVRLPDGLLRALRSRPSLSNSLCSAQRSHGRRVVSARASTTQHEHGRPHYVVPPQQRTVPVGGG